MIIQYIHLYVYVYILFQHPQMIQNGHFLNNDGVLPLGIVKLWF